MLLLTAGLAACADRGHDSGKVDVVASFYPLAEAASRIGGDRVRVMNLTPVGVEPHDIELTPKQVDEIQDADVVIYIGGEFQPAVADVAEKRAGKTVNLAPAADDPHFWLDPVQMTAAADRIAGALRGDATPFKSDLNQLDRDFRGGLADCERKDIVTTHQAFGHLAKRYGLNQLSISGISPEVEPNAARLADLSDQIKARGITTVFFEDLVSPKVAETLAREAHVKTAVLSPIEGLSKGEQRKGKTYLSVMRENLRALQMALGCRPTR